MPRDYDPKLVDRAVHTIQMLAVDGVQKAESGHPGTPMALAAIAFEIWTRHLRYDPKAPRWADRDRFVLSCGHASMLLYGMLHLSGYDLSLDDLKAFRQLNSKTPGHPESFMTPGVETTTGPLGQGIATAVGMAASIKMLAARFEGDGLATARVLLCRLPRGMPPICTCRLAGNNHARSVSRSAAARSVSDVASRIMRRLSIMEPNVAVPIAAMNPVTVSATINSISVTPARAFIGCPC